MVIPALTLGGYQSEREALVGLRPSGKRHRVDVLATDDNGGRFLISLKWQQVSGTAEEKIPYEVICLAHTMRTSDPAFSAAYLVLGGDGWSLRNFYLGRGLDEHLAYPGWVRLMSLEGFVGLANQGRL